MHDSFNKYFTALKYFVLPLIFDSELNMRLRMWSHLDASQICISSYFPEFVIGAIV